MPLGTRSRFFHGVKIALVCLQTTALIGAIFLIITSIVFLSQVDKKPEEYPDNEGTTLIIVALISVLSIMVYIIGLTGALKENLVLTIIYGVFMALNTTANFVTVQIWPAVSNLIATILAFVFAYLIRKEVVATGNSA